MDREDASSHPSPRQPDSLLGNERRDLLRALARRFFERQLGLRNGRLQFSISSTEEHPSIPIIAEQPSTNATTTTRASENSEISSTELPPLLRPDTSASTQLAEAEAGVSRSYTHQEEGVAAEAERLRLTSTPISSIDVRQVARAAETALPFLVLVLIVFAYHHFRALAFLVIGSMLLNRSNKGIQQQVARKAEVQRTRALSYAAVSVLYAELLSLAALQGGVYRYLVLRAAPMGTEFWQVFFTVALVDLYLRLCLSCSKALVVAFSRADSQGRCRRRGALLSFLDYCISAHRALLPTPLWLSYFKHSNLPWLFVMCLFAFYLVPKTVNILERMSLAGAALAQVRGNHHGTRPTEEEMAAAPRECAICQDEVRDPLRLVCGHIFCTDCVEEWLARESSCPMCRREVRRATLKPRSDGATSLFPMLC